MNKEYFRPKKERTKRLNFLVSLAEYETIINYCKKNNFTISCFLRNIINNIVTVKND